MQETFERVTERHGGKAVPIKHFYRRQYQITGGDWRTIIFSDPSGKRGAYLGINLNVVWLESWGAS